MSKSWTNIVYAVGAIGLLMFLLGVTERSVQAPLSKYNNVVFAKSTE